jgi:hypothetical protein
MAVIPVTHIIGVFILRGARVAQSVQCLTMDWAIGVRSQAEAKGFFPLASVSWPALRLTQLPVQWVSGLLPPGLKRGRGVTLTTHPHIVPRSRMSRSYISSPPSAFMACSGTALALFYLFGDAFSTADYTDSVAWKDKWMINWKGCERKRSWWPGLSYYPGIFFEELRKTTKNQSG